MKLIDVQPYQAFNVLLKGDPGTGKTPAALSYPYPLLFFDVDYRAESVIPYFQKDKERLKNIEVIQPKHFEEVKSKLDSVYRSFKQEYKSIVLDTLTTFSDTSIRSTVHDKGGSGGRKVGSVLIPGIQDYGDEAGILTEVMTLMRLIYQTHKINTILIAHVITVEDKVMGKNEVTYSRSLLTAGKKIGAKLPSYFDEVYHFNVRPDFNSKPEFVAKLRHTGFDFARTGLDAPDEIIFTNWERDPKRYFYQLMEPYLNLSKEEYENRLKEEDKVERQETITVDETKAEAW